MPSGQTESPLISAQGLTRIYTAGRRPVVGPADVDLVVDRGERLVLKGNSGSTGPLQGASSWPGSPFTGPTPPGSPASADTRWGWSFRPFTSCPP